MANDLRSGSATLSLSDAEAEHLVALGLIVATPDGYRLAGSAGWTQVTDALTDFHHA